MKFCLWICIVILGLHGGFVSAQVGIGTTSPNASSILDLSSSTKGMLAPRMTQAQRLAIVSPATGLMVYQTDGSNGFWYYDGAVWNPFIAGGAGWLTTGNSGTVDGTHYLGTSDNIPLSFRVNNQLSGRIDHLLYNVFMGYQTGLSNTGASNTFIGNKSGYANTSGYKSVCIGDGAGYNNTTGYRNVYIGYYSGSAGTTATNNTIIGYNAGALQTASYNTVLGAYAGYNNTGGWNCINIGYQAGYNAATSNNLFIGYQCGYNTTGGNNHFVGYQAGYNNTTASNNQFEGYKAAYSNTTGSLNTIIGQSAAYGNTTGSHNTILGINAGYQNTTGSGNTFLGEEAGDVAYNLPNNANTTGSNNTFIGYKSGLGSSTQRTNAAAIGYYALVDADNSLVLGGTGANAVNVGIGTTAPTAKLHVAGSLKVVDGSEGAGKVLTSDANGLASWSVPSGGGRTQVIKTADQSLNSTSWSDVTELNFSVTTGTTYHFYGIVVYTANGTGDGLNLAVSGPASPTFLAYNVQSPNTSGTEYILNAAAYDISAGVSNSIPAGSVAIITGMIVPSTNGTFTIRFAEESANRHTIKAGSILEYW